jgi:hypothetical protein
MASRKPLIDTDGEVRELTAEDMAKFKPAAEVLPACPLERKLGVRGPQKDADQRAHHHSVVARGGGAISREWRGLADPRGLSLARVAQESFSGVSHCLVHARGRTRLSSGPSLTLAPLNSVVRPQKSLDALTRSNPWGGAQPSRCG